MPDVALSEVGSHMHLEGLVKRGDIFLESGGSRIGKIVGNGVKSEFLNTTSTDCLVNSRMQLISPPFFSDTSAMKMPRPGHG